MITPNYEKFGDNSKLYKMQGIKVKERSNMEEQLHLHC